MSHTSLVLEHNFISTCARETRFTLAFRARDRGLLQCPFDLNRDTSMGVVTSPTRHDLNPTGMLCEDPEVCAVHQPRKVGAVFTPLPEKYRSLEVNPFGLMQRKHARRTFYHSEKRQSVSAWAGFYNVERGGRQPRNRCNLPHGFKLIRLLPLQINRRRFRLGHKRFSHIPWPLLHVNEAATRPAFSFPLGAFCQGTLTTRATRFGFHPSPFRLTSHSHQSSLLESRQKTATGIGIPKVRGAQAPYPLRRFFLARSPSYGRVCGASFGGAGSSDPVCQLRASCHPYRLASAVTGLHFSQRQLS